MRLLSTKDIDDLIAKVHNEGLDTGSTYELLGEIITTKVMSTDNVRQILGIDDEFYKMFLKALIMQTTESCKNLVIGGVYEMDKYKPVVNEIRYALHHIVGDTTMTRRMVINFPKEHCFQNMQFIIRDNTLNIMCMMRSCNAIANLKHDILIASIFGDVFRMFYEFSFGAKLYEQHNMKMMIGSLHIFHKDWSV